ncbi:MAG: hypothetical protein KGJ06_03715 [Pseudomonadota bacterium]|nr:hypothetical protein [Pseudomonadota bacterium]
MTQEEEIEKLQAIGYRAMLQAFNKARNAVSPDWAGMVGEKYTGSVYEEEFAPRKSESETVPEEIQVIISNAAIALFMNISACVALGNPAVFDEGINNCLQRGERDDIQRLEAPVLLAGYRAAKAAYLELHPEHKQSLER